MISAPAASIGRVGDAGGDAGAGLHPQRMALGLELLRGLGGECDTGFARSGFGGIPISMEALLLR